jgi:hypothetical protein
MVRSELSRNLEMPRNTVRPKATTSDRDRLSRVYRPPLLLDSESERAASARSALGAPSQYAGGHKRSIQNEHRRPLMARGSKGDQDEAVVCSACGLVLSRT